MNKKTLYHSELVKLGPVAVTVKTDVMPSKFQGKPPFVVLIINGEERNYSCENDECAAFFKGQQGRAFTLVAEGREADAILTYVGEAVAEAASRPAATPPKGAPKKPNRPPATPPTGRQRSATPPPAEREAEQPPASPAAPAGQKPPQNQITADSPKKRACRTANLWLTAYTAARFARAQVKEQLGEDLTTESFQACVSSIFIQLSRDGMQMQMPAGVIDLHGKKSDEAAQ